MDHPKDRSSHSIQTTRLGGLGIAASLVLSCLMFLPFNAFTWAFLTGLLAIIATGLIDDIADIGPRWKFVGQIVAAGAFVGLGGGSLVNLGDFLGLGQITLDLLAVPFTIFCMVGAMNAFNLSDGLDGLAAGLAAITAVFFAYFSWHVGAIDLLLVCVALLGAVMGFLRYNSYPAKLFMGDCGSLTLGYVLAALLVSGSQRGGHHIPLVAWAMVVALPLLDTLLVMARRMYYGHSPFLPDRTHLHHRLMAVGFGASGCGGGDVCSDGVLWCAGTGVEGVPRLVCICGTWPSGYGFVWRGFRFAALGVFVQCGAAETVIFHRASMADFPDWW